MAMEGEVGSQMKEGGVSLQIPTRLHDTRKYGGR